MRVFHLLYHRPDENTQNQQQDPITPIGQQNGPADALQNYRPEDLPTPGTKIGPTPIRSGASSLAAPMSVAMEKCPLMAR